MKNNYIKIEQLLFGYSNGHHLLSTSILLSDRTQKNLEILSDLSGPDVQIGFTEYITGFPLNSEHYYAISKTWYAPEMKRPGCVWTHMLLIKYDDLGKIKYCKDLLDLFTRPSLDVDKNSYSKQLEIGCNEECNIYFNSSIDKLRFISWLAYTNYEPIIIPANAASVFENEIYKFWINQDVFFMRNFSFCSGALANRNIEKKSIDLQIVPYSLLRSIARQNKNAKVVDVSPEKVKYPAWLNYMLDENKANIIIAFHMFRSYYGDRYLDRKYFESFAKLYIETGIVDGNARLEEFLDFILDIFKDEDSFLINKITIEQLLKGDQLQWFNYKSVIDVILDLSIKIDINRLEISYISVDELVDIVWGNYPNGVKCVFRKLTNSKINLLGENLLKGIALKISPDQLIEITDTNIDLCSLMVKLNYKLALCSKLWSQPIDFQLQIINCIELDNIKVELIQQILITIFENTNFDLCDFVYEKFGYIAINTFLDWCSITQIFDDKKARWIRICEKNPSICVKWMLNTDKQKYIYLIIKIINMLDPYSHEIKEIDKCFWVDVFSNLDIKSLTEDSKLKLAQFFMPIILFKKELFPNDFAKFSFNIIYDEIATQRLDYEIWEGLEKLLPEAAWYNSWDKCKRLTKAMRQKGYRV